VTLSREEFTLATRHKSAIKRHRQSLKRRERNRAARSKVRTEVRKLREMCDQNDKAAAGPQLIHTTSELDKAVSKGILHRNAASRRIARLSKRVAAIAK
jgi:small subunit ribosomal protein S20